VSVLYIMIGYTSYVGPRVCIVHGKALEATRSITADLLVVYQGT